MQCVPLLFFFFFLPVFFHSVWYFWDPFILQVSIVCFHGWVICHAVNVSQFISLIQLFIDGSYFLSLSVSHLRAGMGFSVPPPLPRPRQCDLLMAGTVITDEGSWSAESTWCLGPECQVQSRDAPPGHVPCLCLHASFVRVDNDSTSLMRLL